MQNKELSLRCEKAPNGLPDTAEPIVDLFSAQTAHSLAWTWYLVGTRLDKASPLVRPRIAREIERRVLAPYEAREDWGWLGFAKRAGRPTNWTPWINSNVLAATLLLEPDGARRARLTHKVLRSLDAFLGPHPADGGCDEGPSYWGRAGASLFETLEVLRSASSGLPSSSSTMPRWVSARMRSPGASPGRAARPSSVARASASSLRWYWHSATRNDASVASGPSYFRSSVRNRSSATRHSSSRS